MRTGSLIIACAITHASLVGCTVPTSATEVLQASHSKAQITILYDAFGKDPAMQKDWGYAAFIEYDGKRILFDTGNDPEVLEQNAAAKHVDLSKLDFVVMSHRHGDHMGGLSYLLKVNPRASTARTPLCRPNSATTTAHRLKLCALVRHGRVQPSNSSTGTLRLLLTSI